MITASEVAKALYGAWRLARFDPSGLDQFDNTVEAFWRSFYAMLIAAPCYVILVALRLSVLEPVNGPIHIFFVEAIAYVVGWFAFPFVMLYVADFLDRRERYYRYIAAYNWATVLLVALLLIISLGVTGFQLSLPSAAFLSFVITALVLVYWWFIARVGLDVTGRVAAAIAGFDFCLGIALSQLTKSML
jgi:hypothetical protein